MKKKILIVTLLCFLLGIFSFCALAEPVTDSSSSSSSSTISIPSISSDSSKYSSSINESSSSSSKSTNSGPVVSTKATSSKKTNTTSNSTGGGVTKDPIDGEIDTSGWGGSNNESEVVLDESGNPVSSKYTGKKDILNVASVIRKMIWFPILLMLASIGALVYVNSKRFKGTTSGDIKATGRRKAPARRKGGNYRKPRD